MLGCLNLTSPTLPRNNPLLIVKQNCKFYWVSSKQKVAGKNTTAAKFANIVFFCRFYFRRLFTIIAQNKYVLVVYLPPLIPFRCRSQGISHSCWISLMWVRLRLRDKSTASARNARFFTCSLRHNFAINIFFIFFIDAFP